MEGIIAFELWQPAAISPRTYHRWSAPRSRTHRHIALTELNHAGERQDDCLLQTQAGDGGHRTRRPPAVGAVARAVPRPDARAVRRRGQVPGQGPGDDAVGARA